jgi:hypothetical protein
MSKYILLVVSHSDNGMADKLYYPGEEVAGYRNSYRVYHNKKIVVDCPSKEAAKAANRLLEM